MMSTYSCGTDDEPWSTMGNPGSFSITASRTSNANGGGTSLPLASRVHCSGLNLYAPCDVPMDMANESQPVHCAKSITSSGSVYVWCSAETSSSTPASMPSSPSTVTSNWCAYSTTFLVRATFSSYGRCDPSIMTDENPLSMQFLHNSKLSPWSR